MDAYTITTLQRCPRKLLFEQEKAALRRWKPRSLYQHVLTKAILDCSKNGPGLQVAEAVTEFVEKASNPGLDTHHEPFGLAQDWIAIIRTSLEAIFRLGVPLALRESVGFKMFPQFNWKLSSMIDEGCILHRYVAVPDFEKNTIAREMRSWYVAGDVAASAFQMQVHFINVGVTRNGRQHCNWSRAYQHPGIIGRWAFQKKGGGKLTGGWKPFFFADKKIDPVDWVDRLLAENYEPMKTISVAVPSASQRRKVLADIVSESERIGKLSPWQELPIFRPACDDRGPCQWQYECFK